LLKQHPRGTLELLLAAIEKGINCPRTSSVGRLCDAVAALSNLVTVANFDAEAPIRLEAAIDAGCAAQYSYTVGETVKVDDLIAEVVQDVQKQLPSGMIAAKFHNTLVAIIGTLAEKMRAATGLKTVILSGGVFQNRYLLTNAERLLTEKNFAVCSHIKVPANDGGLSLGQLAIAAKRRARGRLEP
jgi:hydrogenase maturation protein HypF